MQETYILEQFFYFCINFKTSFFVTTRQGNKINNFIIHYSFVVLPNTKSKLFPQITGKKLDGHQIGRQVRNVFLFGTKF